MKTKLLYFDKNFYKNFYIPTVLRYEHKKLNFASNKIIYFENKICFAFEKKNNFFTEQFPHYLFVVVNKKIASHTISIDDTPNFKPK